MRNGLYCPNEAKGLYDTWEDEFEKLYETYEKAGKARKQIKAQDLWFQIVQSQIETGTPYMLYKDACNRKSNQQHLGTVRSSNLCTEIIQYTSADEIAVCNLASIALPNYVNMDTKSFDHHKLTEVVYYYSRRVFAGEFTIVNRYLIDDLLKLGLWDEDMKNRIIAEGGSVQNINEIPNELKTISYRMGN